MNEAIEQNEQESTIPREEAKTEESSSPVDKKEETSRRKKIFRFGFSAVLGILGIALALAIIPTNSYTLEPRREPSVSFSQSTSQIKDILEAEKSNVCDKCHSQFFLHEEKTDKVYVLIHGVTNSPRTWVEFGDELYENGNNVMIPLMPYHGMNDLEVNNLKNLKPEELREYADNSVDIAQGLGEEVVVVGLSGGGTVASWIAQNRSDVDTVMLVAPFFGISKLPSFLDTMYVNLFAKIPNINLVSSSEPERDHVYRGESTKGLVAFLRFGKGVFTQSEVNPSGVKNVILITNASDKDVNNSLSKELVSKWENGGAKVKMFEFSEDMNLPHDLIDISQLRSAPQNIYPELLNLLEENKSDENRSQIVTPNEL